MMQAYRRAQLYRLAIAFGIGTVVALVALTAHAQPITCGKQGCSDWRGVSAQPIDANGHGVVGGRPRGCPHAFCGCEASLYVFGEIRPALNPARNWRLLFPRTSPAPGMAAVRTHHVMILIRHVSGLRWLTHDGNSGGGKTRDHVVSIKGYTIHDPHAARVANAN